MCVITYWYPAFGITPARNAPRSSNLSLSYAFRLPLFFFTLCNSLLHESEELPITSYTPCPIKYLKPLYDSAVHREYRATINLNHNETFGLRVVIIEESFISHVQPPGLTPYHCDTDLSQRVSSSSVVSILMLASLYVSFLSL